MGTFLAILVGTIGAGVMMANDSYATVVAGGVVGTAVLGYLASRWIPGPRRRRRRWRWTGTSSSSRG